MALSACVLPRRSYRKNVRTRVLRANPPTTLPARVLRRHAYRERRPSPHSPRGSSDSFTRVRTSSARSPETPHTSAQTFRRLHSRAPCACFVGAFIESADYPRVCRASPPAALPRCAAVRRRFASPPRLSVRRSGVSADIPAPRRLRRSTRPAGRTARAPEALSTSASAAQALRRLHSRAPCACFVGAFIESADYPRVCRASPPAASFTCAMRVFRRRVYRKR